MEKYSANEKAAILLISLGKEYAAELYKHLSEEEIEQLTLSITNVRRIEPTVKDSIIDEFYEICLAQNYISEGGIDYARDILEQAVGTDRAIELINRLSSSLTVRPFDFVRRADPNQLLNFIQGEYPQTIALILSYLDPRQSAQVLASLPADKQTEVIARIAMMNPASPDCIREVERILERKLSSMGFNDQTAVGGIDSIVEILNSVDRGTEKFILETLETYDASLAEEIRNKLFVFEDIAKMSDQAIQRVLREVDNKDLAVALKLVTEEVSQIIFRNISKRLVDMIKEDMEFMGPVRVKEVEEAQQKIVNIIRRLEEAGEVIISRGQDEDIIL